MRASLVAITALALAGSPLLQAQAADAHVGVHPGKGEMVLLGGVSARPAYRPAPPGIALIVDPTPNREINASLGTGEMSDDEFAGMATGQIGANGAHASLPARIVDRALGGSVGGLAGANGSWSGDGIARGVGGGTGTLGGATRSIAPTITGALSQVPLGGNQGTGP